MAFIAAHGFLYSEGSWTTLDDPSPSKGTIANGTLADGINATGQIVGIDETGDHSFLASPVIDDDTSEQAALSLTVNKNSTTPIGAGIAGSVPFTIAGLDSEDTGTVTFTDVNNKTVPVPVSAGTANYTANLTSLADGTITSSLTVNADPSGNSFMPVSGNPVTLDQDLSEQSVLKLTVSSTQNNNVSDTIAGLDPTDDTGTVTFTDVNHKTLTTPIGSPKRWA
jgi:hypothetical protein